MRIDRVTPATVGGVLALYEQYDRPPAEAPSQSRVEAVLAAIDASGGAVFGAFDAERCIGTVTVNLCPNLSWSARCYGMIENVIVDAAFRRQGVAAALLQAAIDHGRSAGCYKLMLLTGSADTGVHRLYQSAGFVATKQGFQLRF